MFQSVAFSLHINNIINLTEGGLSYFKAVAHSQCISYIFMAMCWSHAAYPPETVSCMCKLLLALRGTGHSAEDPTPRNHVVPVVYPCKVNYMG